MENHEYTNSYILEKTGLYKIDTYMEIRRTRWLEKLANMTDKRIPRNLLGSWLPYARRNGTSGRPQQTIRHAYVHTLKKLGFNNCNFSDWMNIAKDRERWGELVENTYGLSKGTYNRGNARHSNATLRSFDNF